MTDIDVDNLNDSLQHFGVKGMKWGVRRAESGVKSAGKSVERTAKKTKAITEDELAAIERRRKIGYEVTKNVVIGGTALAVSTFLANPAAGAAVSATLQATSKAIENTKERGEQAAQDMMKNKF